MCGEPAHFSTAARRTVKRRTSTSNLSAYSVAFDAACETTPDKVFFDVIHALETEKNGGNWLGSRLQPRKWKNLNDLAYLLFDLVFKPWCVRCAVKNRIRWANVLIQKLVGGQEFYQKPFWFGKVKIESRKTRVLEGYCRLRKLHRRFQRVRKPGVSFDVIGGWFPRWWAIYRMSKVRPILLCTRMAMMKRIQNTILAGVWKCYSTAALSGSVSCSESEYSGLEIEFGLEPVTNPYPIERSICYTSISTSISPIELCT